MVSKWVRCVSLGFTLIGGISLGQVPVGSGRSFGTQGEPHLYHLPAAPFQSTIREVAPAVSVLSPSPSPLPHVDPTLIQVPQLPSTNFNHANLPATSVLVPGNAPLATEPRDAISSAAELSLQRTPIASVPSPVLAPSLPANSTKQIVSDGRDALQPGQPLWEVFLQLVRQAAASESRAEAASEVVAAQEDAFAKQIQSVVAEIQDLRQQMPRGEGIGAELAQWKKDDAVAQQRLSELITTKFRELSTKLNADLEKRDREQRGALRKEWESLLKETKAIQQKLVDFSQERKSEEKRLQDLEQENAALRKEIEESRSEQRHLREELQKLERKKKPKK